MQKPTLGEKIDCVFNWKDAKFPLHKRLLNDITERYVSHINI